jgi:hypothetical protein
MTELLDLSGNMRLMSMPADMTVRNNVKVNSQARQQRSAPSTDPSLQITLVKSAQSAVAQSPQRKQPFDLVPMPKQRVASPKIPATTASPAPSTSSNSSSTSASNNNSLLETGLFLANLQKTNPLLMAQILSTSALAKSSIPGLTQLLSNLAQNTLLSSQSTPPTAKAQPQQVAAPTPEPPAKSESPAAKSVDTPPQTPLLNPFLPMMDPLYLSALYSNSMCLPPEQLLQLYKNLPQGIPNSKS